MVKLPKLPDLPDLNSALSVFDKASNAIDKGLSFIDNIGNKLDQLGISETSPPKAGPLATKGATKRVSDEETLKYQLDHILMPLRQIELHLSEGCQISGTPCDCCQKSAMDIRVFSAETIPIAARMGKDPKIFSEIADWASRIEEIGGETNSGSGKYLETYRKESGNASRYRKQIQALLSQATAECETCEAVKTLKEHLEKRQKEV